MADSSVTKKVADRHVMRLYKAVANYVEKLGGNVVVACGVQIQLWPGDKNYDFTVAVKCIGTKPSCTERAK